jgi:ribosomal protein L30/L7E
MDIQNLDSLIDKFISGKDVSMSVANEIEVAIDEAFPEDEFLQETVEMLALYRPEGGEYLLGTEGVRGRLKIVKDYLKKMK